VAARNTGAHQVTSVEEGRAVEAVAFDDVIDAVAPSGRVRLVKLDCEGAEWPILFTSRRLGLGDAILGEYHPAPLPPAVGVEGVTFSVEALERALTEQGSEARIEQLPPVPHPCGLFFTARAG